MRIGSVCRLQPQLDVRQAMPVLGRRELVHETRTAVAHCDVQPLGTQLRRYPYPQRRPALLAAVLDGILGERLQQERGHVDAK